MPKIGPSSLLVDMGAFLHIALCTLHMLQFAFDSSCTCFKFLMLQFAYAAYCLCFKIQFCKLQELQIVFQSRAEFRPTFQWWTSGKFADLILEEVLHIKYLCNLQVFCNRYIKKTFFHTNYCKILSCFDHNLNIKAFKLIWNGCNINFFGAYKVTCHKLHMLQISRVANCTYCKLHVLQISHVANCMCCKFHVLQIACVDTCSWFSHQASHPPI